MPVRTAVVGTGTVSRKHLAGIRSNPRAELVAVCDVDESAALSAAREFGARAETDVSSLLETDIDCLHVCTPVQTHFDIARRAIESDVAVLIEKPATTTVEEVEKLDELARERDVPATVVHNHLFDAALRKSRELIDAGEIGRIKGVDVVYAGLTRPDVENRGSWVFDLPGGEFEEGLPHPLYAALGIGGFPRSDDDVSAQTALSEEYEDDFDYDLAQVQYVSEDDALCSVKMLSGTQPQRLHVVDGTDGSLVVDEINQSVFRVDRDYTASTIARSRKAIDVSASQLANSLSNTKLVFDNAVGGSWEAETRIQSHSALFERFTATILDDAPVPVPLEQSRWTIRLMEHVRDAARAPATAPTIDDGAEEVRAEGDEVTDAEADPVRTEID